MVTNDADLPGVILRTRPSEWYVVNGECCVDSHDLRFSQSHEKQERSIYLNSNHKNSSSVVVMSCLGCYMSTCNARAVLQKHEHVGSSIST